MVTERFAINLRNLIAKNGKTIPEVAEELGYTQQTVYYWTCGANFPNSSALENICTYFECDIQDLFLIWW